MGPDLNGVWVHSGIQKVGFLSILGDLSSWLGCRAKNVKKSNYEVGGDLEAKHWGVSRRWESPTTAQENPLGGIKGGHLLL